eukprot:gnl/TRDRNA2_/TRDRNA2_44769_c0_seq1.p1 gnl/TRDRNA2_/TRDRNA2_44769_c0~~gnl/TRDRNA2_/TRDRNA2_44769_c0_seq1.p1  ORF type:complete len:303 (-),score=32.72 gnl/TRDRNA2_/TRDRNA2_44769_c0_seq1:74-982(-)
MGEGDNSDYHVPLNGESERSQSVQNGRWVKIGLALVSASCLVLLSTMFSAPTPTLSKIEMENVKKGLATKLYLSRAAQSRPAPAQPTSAALPLRTQSHAMLRWPQSRASDGRTVQTAAVDPEATEPTRRTAFTWIAAMAPAALRAAPVWADEEAKAPPTTLCDDGCKDSLSKIQRVKTDSGLEYSDLVVGKGANAKVGFQAVINYEIYTDADATKLYASTLATKGGTGPVDTRVGAGALIKGMEEGILSMKSGGVRRLYVPGDLAWPKGLPAAPGRPRVQPNTPVVVDVQLLYIPGLDDSDE